MFPLTAHRVFPFVAVTELPLCITRWLVQVPPKDRFLQTIQVPHIAKDGEFGKQGYSVSGPCISILISLASQGKAFRCTEHCWELSSSAERPKGP